MYPPARRKAMPPAALAGLISAQFPGIQNKKSGSPHVRRHKTSRPQPRPAEKNLHPGAPQDIPPGNKKASPCREASKPMRAKKSPAAAYFPAPRGSIIGVRELDFRVRYGNGYFLSTMATGQYSQIVLLSSRLRLGAGAAGHCSMRKVFPGKHAPSGGINNMVKPHDLLVMLG